MKMMKKMLTLPKHGFDFWESHYLVSGDLRYIINDVDI